MSVSRSVARSVSRALSRSISGLYQRLDPLLWMRLQDDLSLTSGTGSATFARASDATYIDRNDGLVKTATSNVPRFEIEGYLSEGAATNLLTYSRDFSNAAWGLLSSASLIADQATSPDGILGGDELTLAANTSSLMFQTAAGLTIGNVYTLSCYARSDTGDHIVRFGASADNAGLYANVTVTNEWQRFEVTFTATGTSHFPSWSNKLTATEKSFYIWQADLVELPFASSPIYTTTTAATRLADQLTVTSVGNIPLSPADYSVYAEASFNGRSDLTNYLYKLPSDIASRNAGYLQTASFDFLGPTTDFAQSQISVGLPTFGVACKLCLTMGDTATDAFGYKDGVSTALRAQQNQHPIDNNSDILIGWSDNDPTRGMFGHIKDFQIYDVELTATEVPTLPNVPKR